MQQTADVDANATKDQMDVDSETTLVSGLSYFFYSAVVIAAVQDVADATIAACGLSSSYSAVVALEVLAADADAMTTAATKM